MRIGIVLTMAGLVMVGGCGTAGTNVPTTPSTPAKAQWKAPYNLDLNTKAAKPKTAAGVALPGIRYTANSQALERRASLVVRFQPPATKDGQPAATWVILYPTDLPGTTGTLTADYMDTANQQVTKLLARYGAKGTVKVNMALVRSSIRPDANENELNSKRLTEWVPAEVVVKGPRKKG